MITLTGIEIQEKSGDSIFLFLRQSVALSGTLFVIQASLEFMAILLLKPSECWNYECEPLCPAGDSNI